MTDSLSGATDRGGKSSSSPVKNLTPQAERALAEAAQRRREIETRIAALPPERGGRGGSEPIRYGDWEVKGLATDF